MKPLLIKVCGMRDADNVRQVEALTPDMMGFICWEGSRRHVSRLPDYLPETCRRVGVFVNPEIGYVQERLKTFRLDLVQLHGHETPEFCRSIKEEGLKSYRALQSSKPSAWLPTNRSRIPKITKRIATFSYSTHVAPRLAAVAGRSIGMSCKTTTDIRPSS